MVGTYRKWWRFRHALSEVGGLAVPTLLTPDPDTDLTAPTTGSMPSTEDFDNWLVTEEKWRSFSWNPVVTPVVVAGGWRWSRERQSGLSRKPTWAAASRFYETYLRAELPNLIDWRARRAIAAAYHPKAPERPEKEWEVRLSGRDTTALDAERLRLIAVCHALEARVAAAANLAELEALEWFSDGVWRPATEDQT